MALTPENLPKTIEACHAFIIEQDCLHRETLAALFQQIEKLHAEIEALKERLKTDSGNSSLPPSRSRKKPLTPRKPSGRKSGGQPGHKGHFRMLAPTEEVDETVLCQLPALCSCGGVIHIKDDAQLHHVYELPRIKLHLTEYRLEKGLCTYCWKNHVASLPQGVTCGITGPNLTAMMSHMVSRYQLSRRELREFLREHYDFKISLGTIFRKQKIVNMALEKPAANILETVKNNPCTHMDETGHNRDGKREWLWGVMSQDAAFFRVFKSRGKKVVAGLMGGYSGIVVTDRYAGYNLFPDDRRQFCWAHLKRDFTRLSQKSDAVVAGIGRNLLACQEELFDLWHGHRNGEIMNNIFRQKISALRTRMERYLEQGSNTDPALKTSRFCKNLLEHSDALWTFASNNHVEPTNNHAERCIRPAVTWRKKYFETRSDYGSEFVGRIMSLIMTCRLQSKSSFDMLRQVMENWFFQQENPLFC